MLRWDSRYRRAALLALTGGKNDGTDERPLNNKPSILQTAIRIRAMLMVRATRYLSCALGLVPRLLITTSKLLNG
jgi:hypothetical protein